MRYFIFALLLLAGIGEIVNGIMKPDTALIIKGFILTVPLTVTFILVNKVLYSAVAEDALKGMEKAIVLITCLFAPIVSGAFYYYCWRHKYPNRANTANKYSFLMFGIIVLFVIGTIALTQ